MRRYVCFMNIMMLPPPTGLTGRLSVLHKFRVVAPARQRRTFAAQAPAAEAQVGEAAKVAGKYFWVRRHSRCTEDSLLAVWQRSYKTFLI